MSDALNVLVVDDEPSILQSCTRVLERAGHHVAALGSGRSAIALFQERSFDLVLTDIMMPDIGGLELIQQFKALVPEATIVVITGYGTVETATEALRKGASGFLTKPFTPAELRSAVAEAFAKGQATRDAIRAKAYEPLTAQISGRRGTAGSQDLLTLLTQSTRSATGADLAALFGQEDASGLATRAADGDREAQRVALSGPFRTWLSQAVARSRSSVSWSTGDPAGDGMSLDDAVAETLGLRALMACPVLIHDQPYGALVALRLSGSRPFSDGDLAFLRIQAHQATAILEGERLHRELNAAYLSVVVSLANALEARDAYTSGHCERMATLGAQLAVRVGLNAGDVEAIRLGGVLHDIGKIGVPDAILLKAGSLTEEEREVIQRHTDIGFQIVEPIKGLRQVLPIIRHHHERFDGQGYPLGLRGEEIPIGARVLGVCDAFEAMTSTRPYRPALPRDETLDRLKKGVGTQFDPDILRAFLDLIET